ncbi:MAG: D-glycero-beta-D-manno-heptose 1,7-bisphosphate 7-phosphatase [Alcaligenaceae bacterium]|nr:D-glycero-beta-D-manno-heptose 1,7-bisphosphate 7-phosphatase [Alcaligenaceae bacterium]
MKIAVLDRDGVINEDRADFVKSADEWIPLPGSLEAIARLYRAGWKIVIASNQSGIGRGLFNMEALNQMHAKMHQELTMLGGQVDAIFICPHTPDEGCTCRKPLPGMFHDILRRYEVDPSQVLAVGDSLRDIQAATAAGLKTWLVETGNGLKTKNDPDLPPDTQIRPSLADIVNEWLKET